jgi:DNA polymerase-3 subunit epsilon
MRSWCSQKNETGVGVDDRGNNLHLLGGARMPLCLILCLVAALTSDFLNAELFPELPASPSAPKARTAKASKVSPSPAAVSVASALAPSPELQTTAPAVLESWAQSLEAHPDYRVIRRLQPRLLWPAPAGQKTLQVVVLDTETTGLNHTKDKIIEMALLRVEVDLSTGLPVGAVEVFDELEDPGMPIPKEAMAITGITDQDVAGKRLDEGRIAALMDGVDVVIAHNAGFDRPFCEARLPLFRNVAWACSFADLDWKAQGRSSSKLEALAQGLGLFYDAHRAEMDCHALLAVLAAPLPNTPESTAMAGLLASAQTPFFRLQATGAPFDAKDLLKARAYRWSAELRVWHTRLSDEAALEAECAWLKAEVYGQRSASVMVEKVDALSKYAARSGAMAPRSL